MSKMNFGDKERMTDILSSEKYLASLYCDAVTESSTGVRSTFVAMLGEAHEMQFTVWKEMNSRGWYPTEQAQEKKLEQQKQTFASSVRCPSCH